MSKNQSQENQALHSRRSFLRSAGLGVAAITLSLVGRDGRAGGLALDTKSYTAASSDQCEPVVWDLIAGRNQRVGSVIVSNTDTEITVQFFLDTQGASLGAVHLWLGRDQDAYPQTHRGVPVPGQFPYAHHASGATSHTFTVALSDLGIDECNSETTVHIAAHAEVRVNNRAETAWGGPLPGPGPRWWFRGEYQLCCELKYL